MRLAAFLSFSIAATMMMAQPVTAMADAGPGAGAQQAAVLNPYRQLQELDAQLNRVVYRLATVNSPFCEVLQGQVGLILHTESQYPKEGRAAFGFAQPVQVLAIAPNSPAALADVRLDDGVVAIDAADMLEPLGDRRRRGGDQLADVTDLMQRHVDMALINNEPTLWRLSRQGQQFVVPIMPVAACRARWQVIAGQKDHAGSDGKNISISYDFMRMADELGGDDALSVLAAHELAHIMLGHRAYLAGIEARLGTARGDEARALRKTLAAAQQQAERDADLLSQWLVTNAGYQSEPGMALYDRIARRDFLYYSPKHGPWSKRIAAMRAEQARVMATPVDADGLRAPPLLFGKGTYPW